MVSVCATCASLQQRLRAPDPANESAPAAAPPPCPPLLDAPLADLRASAAACRACALVLNGLLLHHDRLPALPEDRVRVRAESVPRQHHLSVELRWRDDDDPAAHAHTHAHDSTHNHTHSHASSPDLKLEFFTDSNVPLSFSAVGRGRRFSEHPLLDTGLTTARDMISRCLSSHARCRHARPTTLPKRVLDLLGDNSKSVHLHEAHFIDDEQRFEYGEYLALSHLWGPSPSLPTTTSENLSAYKKGVPWASLPRVFQEAIALTRALNFRYLWIDSLCLLHDRMDEKLEESINMDAIYGNAFLTIAATSTPDSSQDPLFVPKTPPFAIQATDNKGSAFKVFVREQPTHYGFKAPFDDVAHINDWEAPFNVSEEANLHAPLLQRAWPLVERLLSPRVLHFTDTEIILECREGHQCECGRIDDPALDPRSTDTTKQQLARLIAETSAQTTTNGVYNNPDRRVDSIMTQLASTTLANGNSQELTRKREEALQLWSTIITEFTARSIGTDSDRLVAIAGIAKTLASTLRSGYIAGQWTFSTLGLLWYPNDSTQCRRPRAMDGQTIPTWSWASVEGSPIFFDNASAMDLSCKASFGLKGKRASAWSPIMGEPLELAAAMATEVRVTAPSSASPQSPLLLVKNRISVEFTPDVCPPTTLDDTLQDGETLVCVLVSMTFRSSIVGLVLKPLSNNLYRRVGRFECYECTPEDGEEEMSEDAETLFGHWFPEIDDMTQVDHLPKRQFAVI